MPIITFWSETREETAKTLSIVAAATHMAINHQFKILVLSTAFEDDTLENCFWDMKEGKKSKIKITDTKKINIDSGLEGLQKLYMSNRLTPDQISNYTKVVFANNRLEVIPISKTTTYETYEKTLKIYEDVIEAANMYYDYVFVDLNKGFRYPELTKILDISDLIVVNLTQRIKIIDNYMKLREENPMFKQPNVMLLLGRYDKYSKYSAKNVSRYMGEKKLISTVPYNTLFFEACGEGDAADYFLKFKTTDVKDRNGFFISEIAKLNDNIINTIQMLQRNKR